MTYDHERAETAVWAQFEILLTITRRMPDAQRRWAVGVLARAVRSATAEFLSDNVPEPTAN